MTAGGGEADETQRRLTMTHNDENRVQTETIAASAF